MGTAKVYPSRRHHRQNREDTEEHLLLVEHPPVFTLGRHGHAENMLVSEDALAAKGIEFVRIERGGDITFHGPGQLVAYPIIDLQRHHLGVKDYVNLLEEAVIRTIAHYGITGERVEGATGVWIDKGLPGERKICAIGVKCTRFVTMHGLALNINTDLHYFGANKSMRVHRQGSNISPSGDRQRSRHARSQRAVCCSFPGIAEIKESNITKQRHIKKQRRNIKHSVAPLPY